MDALIDQYIYNKIINKYNLFETLESIPIKEDKKEILVDDFVENFICIGIFSQLEILGTINVGLGIIILGRLSELLPFT